MLEPQQRRSFPDLLFLPEPTTARTIMAMLHNRLTHAGTLSSVVAWGRGGRRATSRAHRCFAGSQPRPCTFQGPSMKLPGGCGGGRGWGAVLGVGMPARRFGNPHCRGTPLVPGAQAQAARLSRRDATEVGLQLPCLPGCEAESGVIKAAPTSSSCPAVLVMTTDAGSDMAAGTLMLDEHLKQSEPNRWGCVRQFCLQHQLHLVVSKQISRADRTWPLLCMLAHLWRHHSVRFRMAFEAELGAALCKGAANAPPLPVRGRWGTAHACEAHVLRHERAVLLAVPVT
jgi:hypothetical protein